MKRFIDKYNLFFFIPLVVLMIASFFCMFESRFVKELYTSHLVKQILWFFVGFLILFLLQKIKVKFLFRYSFYFYLLGVFLLLLVLVFGHEVNGARAWFSFKIFNFQPSEFMKIALLLYLAKLTNDFQLNEKKKEFFYIVKCVLVVLIPSILVFLEPDTGAIMMYLLLLIAVLFVSGIRKRWFVLAFLCVISLGGGFFYLYFFQQDTLIRNLSISA